jgi:hypothetical protein
VAAACVRKPQRAVILGPLAGSRAKPCERLRERPLRLGARGEPADPRPLRTAAIHAVGVCPKGATVGRGCALAMAITMRPGRVGGRVCTHRVFRRFGLCPVRWRCRWTLCRGRGRCRGWDGVRVVSVRDNASCDGDLSHVAVDLDGNHVVARSSDLTADADTPDLSTGLDAQLARKSLLRAVDRPERQDAKSVVRALPRSEGRAPVRKS